MNRREQENPAQPYNENTAGNVNGLGPPPFIPYHTKPVLNTSRLQRPTQHQEMVTTAPPPYEDSIPDSATETNVTTSRGSTNGLPLSIPADDVYWNSVDEFDTESLNTVFSNLNVTERGDMFGPDRVARWVEATARANPVTCRFSPSHRSPSEQPSLRSGISAAASQSASTSLAPHTQASPPSTLFHEGTSRSIAAHPLEHNNRKGKYYVVIQGRAWGVYDDWLEVKPLVTGVDGIFKTYTTYDEALRAFARCRERGRLKIV